MKDRNRSEYVGTKTEQRKSLKVGAGENWGNFRKKNKNPEPYVALLIKVLQV